MGLMGELGIVGGKPQGGDTCHNFLVEIMATDYDGMMNGCGIAAMAAIKSGEQSRIYRRYRRIADTCSDVMLRQAGCRILRCFACGLYSRVQN
jgi:hypothetical protein